MKKSFSPIFIIVAVITLVAIIVVLAMQLTKPQAKPITNFEECRAAGYPVMESLPERCQTREGQIFTNEVAVQEVTIKGEFVCLPHKDQSGPQTLECAFGLKDEKGIYYALKDSDPTYKNISSVNTGDKVLVNGKLTPDATTIYQSVGTIEVTKITQ